MREWTHLTTRMVTVAHPSWSAIRPFAALVAAALCSYIMIALSFLSFQSAFALLNMPRPISLARDHNFSQAEVAITDGIGRDWGRAWEPVRVCGRWALSLSLPAFLRTSGSSGCGIRVDPTWPVWESESTVAACPSKPFSGEKPNSTSWPVVVARHSCAVGGQGLVTMWMGWESVIVSVTSICAHISSNLSNMTHIWYHIPGMVSE